MTRFTLTQNIRRYRQLLAGSLEPERRRVIESLLAEEEAALARASQTPDAPPRPDGPSSS
jgi:hypothetical protein